MNHMALVFGAGVLAGAMNALAGGGSFVSLPALIAAGVPSVQANASSTVALFPGGMASAWAYRDGMGPIGAVSSRSMLLVTLIGGAMGAILLLRTPTTIFDVVLPWLLLLATALLGFGRRLGEMLRRRCRISPRAVLAVQLCLGIYGGYFGGAVGIMMTAAWGLLDTGRDVKSLNGPRTLLVTAANTIAAVFFAVARAVQWPNTLMMLVGALLGGYGGAQIGRRAPSKIIRRGTLLLTGCITLIFFFRAYVGSSGGQP
jgi:uncharacterized membrane protein YfcA